MRILPFLVLLAAWGQARAETPSALNALATQSASLRPWVRTDLARTFLAAVADLPPIESRTVFHDRAGRRALTLEQAEGRGESELEGYERTELDEEFYYNTRYGTPLAFARPLDLLGEAGLATLDGARIIDFGFGTIGQLRLMASCGATVVGIEVDPLLKALYSHPGDTGTIAPASTAEGNNPGSLRLLFGQFPADDEIREQVGAGFDAFVSKNTLKNGYIHPAEEVDPRMLVQLGVDDATFVHAVHEVLKPGGWFLVYNLCPPPSPDRYIPWSDGRCPFPRELLEASGFQVLAYDVNDDAAAREMGSRLGWAEQMDLQADLFGIYTLARKRP